MGQYNQFVDDTVEDIIHSIDYLISKTGLGTSYYRCSSTGECRECQRPGPKHWCIPYQTRRFQRKFKKWTSGSEELDEFIRQTQLASTSRTKVALKCLDNSQKITNKFLEEIKTHHRAIIGDHMPRCYGITRGPNDEYMIVMQYANEGSIRSYFNKSFIEIGWRDKLQMLKETIEGLRLIHNTGFLHRDLHTGNLLRNVDEIGCQSIFIADLGLTTPLDDKRASTIVDEKPQNSSSYEPTNYEFIEFEEAEVVDSGQLDLFIPKTARPRDDLPKIPELRVDSLLFPLDS
ncbi:13832_t:CDS:2 [Ambispora leptoticha]|uniref:13832_t:CDS:1 n=1 Tax=Ambispora leptoticha TaxID=144679 RepID=A0A9N8ZHF6_9GLOM|nr:13832_t:CDS:2 [Ambispora leptoticha]